MGFLGAAARLLGAAKDAARRFGERARNARNARRERKAGERKTSERKGTPQDAQRQRKADRTAERFESVLNRQQRTRSISDRVSKKLFYERTRQFWEGKDPLFRDSYIMDGLGVSSLEDAKATVFSNILGELQGKYPDDWESMTDEERYRWALSVLARR